MTTDLNEKYPGAGSFKFGDNAKLSGELITLVRSGKKTATCGKVSDFEPDGSDLPVVGRRDIALNWDGTPACVIETLSVETMPFDQIGEDFALAEGENDSHAGWYADHKRFFERGSGFSKTMMIVCERFKLIEDLADWEQVE